MAEIDPHTQDETSNGFQIDDKNNSEQSDTINVSDAVKCMETACADFKNLYLHDLQGWVDRTPKVETNTRLEQTTEELSQVLSNIYRRTEANNTIRSSVNGIASKSRELDSYLHNSR